jgi:dUTP pyrophosphatase
MSKSIQIHPIINTKFGDWTVISDKVLINKKKSTWLCRCKCGKEQYIDQWNLHKGNTTQCQRCAYNDKMADEFDNLFNKSQRSAKDRGLEFNITKEDIKLLFNKQDGKCALSGIKLNIFHSRRKQIDNDASLDRIDSSKGYINNNIQWVHKKVNIMKMNLDETTFIDLCKKIINYDISQPKKLKIKKLHPDAIEPQIGTEFSACYDLYALEDVKFAPGEIKVIRTGWKMEPPKGWRINIYVRSSTPAKKGFILANSLGIMDEDYRGEFGVQLMNIKVESEWKRATDDSGGVYDKETVVFAKNKISKGDKIAQFELVASNPAAHFPLLEAVELSATQRGEGGFGSTGK